MTHRSFLFQVVAGVTLWLAVVALVTVLVDPYGVWGTPKMTGVNAIKPQKENHERIFKAGELRRIRPRTILIGTSTVHTGLEPSAIDGLVDGPVYNAGIASANMAEIAAYCRYSMRMQPDLTTIVLGLDLMSFDRTKTATDDFPGRLIRGSSGFGPELLPTALSATAVADSWTTVRQNADGTAQEKFSDTGRRTDRFVGQRMEEVGGFYGGIDRRASRRYDGFRLSRQGLDQLAGLKEECDRRGVRLVAFVTPMHASEYEVFDQLSMLDDLYRWKRSLSTITPVWDFATFEGDMVALPDSKDSRYWDGVHYRRELGDKVLRGMLTGRWEPGVKGVLLTPSSVDAELMESTSRFRDWQSSHQATRRLVSRVPSIRRLSR